MDQSQWDAVDDYATDLLIEEDAALKEALRATEAAGLPAIAVSPAHGKLLHLLARMQKAQDVLEIGTLGGYSTIWLARALGAAGRVVTLEVDPKHAEVARANLARAGVDDQVEIREGRAIDTLPLLFEQGYTQFDFVFIDADKPSTPDYFKWALRLARPGAVIVVDNVVRRGALVDAASNDPGVQGMRRLIEMLAAEPNVTATLIQTVGSKGYDGFVMALVSPGP